VDAPDERMSWGGKHVRRTAGFVGLIAGVVLVAAACSSTASPSPSASSAGAGGGASASAAGGGASASAPLSNPDLVGTDWALGDFPGQVLGDVRPTIAFSGDGTVSGTGGCNTFSGTYTTDGSKLTFGPLAATQKACSPEAVSTLEGAYLAALQAVTAYEITSAGQLKLTSGSTTLTYAKGT
jgi:heat shock protein HslJ